jgi:hypothetical protein
MKLIMKVLTVVLILFMANTVSAITIEPGFIVKNLGGKVLNFNAKDMISKDFEIKFQDNQGALMFSEYVTSPVTFERNYNLSELPNGAYFLLVVNDAKTQTLPITIDADGMKIDLEKLETIQYASLK